MVMIKFKTIIYIFSMGILIVLISNIILSSKEIVSKGTIALPVTNKVIVIDAGHGLPDQGAESSQGTTEQAINLSITLKLQKLIEQSGGKVILTRSDENGIYSLDEKSIRNKKVSDMKNRKYIGNNSDSDIFVSVHLNKFPDPVYRGWQTFFQKNSDKSKLLANMIQTEINENIDCENKREPMQIQEVYLMNKVNIPSVIVECGFISNTQEEILLKQEEYQNKLAWGVYLGIQEYFRKG